MSYPDAVFTTEVPELRPFTTHPPHHHLHPENTVHLQLKQLKDRARSMQQEYLEQKIHHGRVKKNVDEINHQSALKRVQFLKVYGNKKAKFHTRQLLQTHKHQRQRFQRKSLDLVKRRKLQYELQQILQQNEQQDRIYQLQKSNQHNKDIFKRKLLLANQRERVYQHHQDVRKAHNQFLIRKRNLQTAITLRSKRNYYSKVNQELTLIQNYEKILNEVENITEMEGFNQSKIDDSTMCHTIDRGQNMFLTSKNTIQ